MIDGDCLVNLGQVAVEYLPYYRAFRQPLWTHHGAWAVREGILLKVTNGQGEVGFGEIAPLEWFGSESLAEALAFCEQLPQTLEFDFVDQIPDTLPATQMGFESAFDSAVSKRNARLTHSFPSSNSPQLCGLLPTGEAALTTYSSLYQQGYRTFKVKIGVADRVTEQAWLNKLIQRFAPDTKLRLDANGGLSTNDVHHWLEWCDRNFIEFLEQPLPVDQVTAMQTLAEQYQTPLALDESVATLRQLQDCYQKGWRGIFVVKSAIAGSPRKLRQFCQKNSVRLVFSTVFETVIGRQAALNLATELNAPDLAIGFGVGHWFDDDWDELGAEELWERVGESGRVDGWMGGWAVKELGLSMNLASYLEERRLDDWWINGDSNALRCLIEAKWRELDQVKSQTAQPVVLLVEAEPVRFLAGLLAAGSRDCALVLANPGWRDREWQQVAQLIKPDVIWSDTPLSIFQPRTINHSPFTNSPSTLPPNAVLIPTGGSSGEIKFAIHTWDTLTASVRGFQQHFQVDTVSCYCTLPLYHVSGLMQVLRSHISGGQLIIQPFRELQQSNCVISDPSNWFLSLVPTQLQRLLLTQHSILNTQHSTLNTHPPIHPSTPSLLTPHSSPHSPLPLLPWLATLKAILLGGGAAWPQLFSQARQLGLPLAPTYGMTETASQVAALQPQDFLAGNESCGRVLPHAEITIHDETGAILPPGQPGQVRIQTKSLALGYLSFQPTTNFLSLTPSLPHSLTPPLLHSKLKTQNSKPIPPSPIPSFQPDDQGYLDPDGNLHIVGRNSTKIITGGENVFPEEVEAVIRATGLVADVCVVGVRDAEWGQMVTAIWVPGVDTDRERIEEKLRSAIATQLSKYKHPKRWLMVEKLPRNAQGKIVRSQLLVRIKSMI